MSFELVICVVVYRVFTGACDSEGRHIHTSSTTLGDFETQRDADQALADAGFTRQSWGGWTSHSGYSWGSVSRLLIEEKN